MKHNLYEAPGALGLEMLAFHEQTSPGYNVIAYWATHDGRVFTDQCFDNSDESLPWSWLYGDSLGTPPVGQLHEIHITMEAAALYCEWENEIHPLYRPQPSDRFTHNSFHVLEWVEARIGKRALVTGPYQPRTRVIER